MVTRWKLNCGRAVTMLCVAASAQVHAADSSESAGRAALEEVVVTATKRGETDVQKTAESIYAVSGADLTLKRETTFEAFAGSVPGPAVPAPRSRRFRIHHPRHQRQRTVRGRCLPRRVRHHCERPAGRRRQECPRTARRCRARRSAQRPAGNPVRVELDGRQHPLHHATSRTPRSSMHTARSTSAPSRTAATATASTPWSTFRCRPTNSRSASSAIAKTATAGSIRPASNARRADTTRLQRHRRGHQLDRDHRRPPQRALDTQRRSHAGRPLRQAESGQRRLAPLHEQGRARVSGPAAGNCIAPRQHGLRAAAGPRLVHARRRISSTRTSRRARARTTSTCWERPLRWDTGVGGVSLAASQYEHEIDFTFDSTPILLFFGVPIAGITQQPQEYKTKMAELRFASDFDSPFNFVTGAYYQKDDNEFNVHVVTTDGSGGPNAVQRAELGRRAGERR